MTDHEIIEAMSMFGGGFAQALAYAFRCADTRNQERIKAAFPDLWKQYEELAQFQRVARAPKASA